VDNTSSDLTIKFRNSIILDWDERQYDIALDSPTSVPIADYNVRADRDNSTLKYTWSGTAFTITVPDGYRSITEIQDYIRAQLLASGHVDVGPPVGYPITFTNDYSSSIISFMTNEYMRVILTPGASGYASGLLGLFGFVGNADGATDAEEDYGGGGAGTTSTYTPLKIANINDQVTGYYINCDITNATIDANGESSAIKQYITHESFGSRQDFTNTGQLRWCSVDRANTKIDQIRVWVTDNRHRPVDWHGEASTFVLLLRERKLTV
jgi:hypothetical protein